ncbi:MAG TPA: hypothetical protein VIG71_09465, partial [Enteractinococcus sp.]
MALQGWQRQYLDALLRGRTQRVAQFETVDFFATVIDGSADAVQELLLHRLIGSLESLPEALRLLETIRNTGWKKYGPRILARIGDTEAVIKNSPELAEYFQLVRDRTGYTTYSIKDWRLIGDGTNLRRPDAPVWSGRTTSIQKLIDKSRLSNFGIAEIADILQHYFDNGIRVFQLGILTFVDDDNQWAQVLHRVITAPYIEICTEPYAPDSFITASPAPQWTPHWQIVSVAEGGINWDIHEVHTGHRLQGLGTAGIYDQISVLLAVSGLLREGINLCPIDEGLVKALTPSHPIWGFRKREFSASRTTYQAEDVRGLALGFLERLPATPRVSMFRSRLAIRLVGEAWVHRNSASMLSDPDGFYQNLIRTAQLFGEDRFTDVLDFVAESPYGVEPAFRFFADEAQAALDLFKRLETLAVPTTSKHVEHPDHILCVTHASVPEQTGGYAIRAHG